MVWANLDVSENFIVSELFLNVLTFFKALVALSFGKSISYTVISVNSLFTNRSSKLLLSVALNSWYLTLSLAKLASLTKLSSNSFASSLFSSNLPIFFFPMISAFNLLLMTFLLTSSTHSTKRFSKSLL